MEAYLIVGIATSGWIASNSDERLGIADVALIALMWPFVFAAIASRGK